MPSARQTASTASNETMIMLPSVPSRSGTDPTSYFYEYTEPLPPLPPNQRHKLRTAVISGDPYDVSVDWQNYSFPPDNSMSANTFPFSSGAQGGQGSHSLYSNRGVLCGQRAPPVFYRSILKGEPTNRILVLNTAHEKKPGGDWERGCLTQEEGFSRRSNLAQALHTQDPRSPSMNEYYPLPHTGAIYSPSVVVFREGFAKDYKIWPDEQWTTISVVSAPAVKRPKMDGSSSYYAFEEERDFQKDKMKSVLRVAALNGHINLVLSGFGSCGQEGSGACLHKNPIKDVCRIWEELLFHEPEFIGWFANIVFALGDRGGGWMKEDEAGIKWFQASFG